MDRGQPPHLLEVLQLRRGVGQLTLNTEPIMEYEHWEHIVELLKGEKLSKKAVEAMMVDAIKADSGGDYGQGCAALIYKLHPDREYCAPEYRNVKAKELIHRMIRHNFYLSTELL